jgi:DNA polymerase sigma
MGMSVPEVDLVVSINPDALPGQLRGRLSRTGGASTAKLDARKVQKSAIRACTDRLVSDGGFKFRRSAFKGQEPKITLLAPTSFGPRKSNFDEAAAFPVDLSVNTVTPQCNDAVLRASRKFDSRAQALIVLVRRWARDRGICHSAKGHLSPYAWSLLTAFYLQVAPAGGGAMLPPLEGVVVGKSGFSLGQVPAKEAPVQWTPTASGVNYAVDSTQRKSVLALFREFVLFYHKDFNWRSEAVSLQVGRRAAPELSLPLHIVVSSDGVPTQVGPHIQDPFEPKTNLGTSMTPEGFVRMQEELARAFQILNLDEPSLAELLEPWVASASMEQEADGEMANSSRRESTVTTFSTSSW